MSNTTVQDHPPVILVTGMSGAGKTQTLKFLEDRGCYVLDNIPLSLCSQAVTEAQHQEPLVLGMDIRTLGFDVEQLLWHVSQWKQHTSVTMLFLDALDEVLVQRYRETRRAHPLGSEHDLPVLIAKERALIGSLMTHANDVIDTSTLTPPELKHRLGAYVRSNSPMAHLYLMSFSYRRGLPTVTDCIIDMRFLPNPFYQAQLKALTGESPEIDVFFQNDPQFQQFYAHMQAIVLLWLQEARPSFLWAFGCTGGKHRSVYTVEVLSRWLGERGYTLTTHHRDI